MLMHGWSPDALEELTNPLIVNGKKSAAFGPFHAPPVFMVRAVALVVGGVPLLAVELTTIDVMFPPLEFTVVTRAINTPVDEPSL